MTKIKNMDLENRDVTKQKRKDGQKSTVNNNNRLIMRTPQPTQENRELLLEAKQDTLDAEDWILKGRKFAAKGNAPMAALCFLIAGFFIGRALAKAWRTTHPYTEKDFEEFKAVMEKAKDPAYPYGNDLRRPPTWEIEYPEIERKELFPWEETAAAKGISREARGGEKGLVGMRMALQAHKDKLKALGAANSTEGLVEEPERARRTRGGSKGPDVTKFRSEPIPNDVPALTSPPDHTPPAASEFPLPFSSQFIPPAERSQSPPPQYRFSGPFTALSPAATAALATPAYTPPSVAGAAASGAPQVIITGITPPPTRLADAEFKRCLQRELNDIVRNFDTGMWV